jgi:hypothetical protein
VQSAEIVRSRLAITVAAGGGQTRGIDHTAGSLTMVNSILELESEGNAAALRAASEAIILNNTIIATSNSPNPDDLLGGLILSTPTADIRNNIVSADATGEASVQAIGGSETPPARNNTFFNGGGPVSESYDGVDGNVTLEVFGQFAFFDPSGDDGDVTNDFALSSDSPAHLIEDGLDLSGEGLLNDFNGNPRTGDGSLGYSRGALELDQQ